MKRLTKYLIIILLSAFISLGTIYFAGSRGEVKFVSMAIVFAESDIKKVYDDKLIAFEVSSNVILQDIQKEIKDKEAQGMDAYQIQLLRQGLTQRQNELSEEYQKKSQSFHELVWNELNDHIETYGKEHGFKYILGATGDGAIMYADEAEDITKDVIKYINK